MNFDLSEDQQVIKRTAREFLGARYKLEEVRRLALEEERGFTDAQWEEIAGLGWPEIAVGDEALGIVELAVVAEELGYACAPTPLQSTWAAGLLLDAADEAGRLSDGRRGTVAQWDEDTDGTPDRSSLGEDLRGVKIAVPDAAAADVIVVTADGGRHFVVHAADVEIEPVETLDTTRRLATVRLDGPPAEELSGDPDAVAYAKDRTQFERPIGTYQAASHACAQMLLEVEGARSAVLWAAWALDHEPETASMATNIAKAYASDCGVRVTASALQVHGGIGFTWEHDLHFFLKRAQANAHASGDARWHRDELAAALFD
jgi:alkylation response protein AidB-like acyl-CoA dehydrogenase